MGHTKFSDLEDLHNELDIIRSLPSLQEKSPGVFYFKSIPFLHFHDKDGVRWADVKVDNAWLRIEIDFKANSVARKKFLKKIQQAHAGLSCL